jgi:hypothetical protein
MYILKACLRQQIYSILITGYQGELQLTQAGSDQSIYLSLTQIKNQIFKWMEQTLNAM